MASMNLNTEELPDSDNLEPVPGGVYAVEIVESDTVVPNSGKGEMLKVTMEVIEGPYVNRKIWDNILYVHPNEDAQRIGQQKIKSICKAVGFAGQLEDSTQLHSVPFQVRVIIEEKDGYAPKNVVKAYLEGAQATASPAPRQTAASTRQAAPVARQSAPATATGGRGAPAFMNRR